MATRLYLLANDWEREAGRKRLSKIAGSSLTTYTTNTATSTEVQWTGSAGGQVLEWCTLPLGSSATIGASGGVTFNIWAVESNMSANAGGRARLFKVSNDRATWTEMGGGPFDDNVEFALGSKAQYSWTGTPTSNNALSAGDRLGVRIYIDDNCGVAQASGYTASIGINGNTADADGDTWIEVVETLVFGEVISPGVGSLTLTGAAPDRYVDRLVPGVVGALVLAGYALVPAYAIPGPAPPELTVTGYEATLVEAPVEPTGELREPPAGTLDLTAATPTLGLAVPPVIGALTLTGAAPSLALSVAVPSASSSRTPPTFAQLSSSTTYGTNMSQIDIDLDSLPSVGQMIVVSVYKQGSSYTGISDNAVGGSNTYNLIVTGGEARLYYTIVERVASPAGSHTVTVTLSGTASMYGVVAVFEAGTFDATNPVDDANGTQVYSTSAWYCAPAGEINPAAGTTLIGWMCSNNTPNPPDGAYPHDSVNWTEYGTVVAAIKSCAMYRTSPNGLSAERGRVVLNLSGATPSAVIASFFGVAKGLALTGAAPTLAIGVAMPAGAATLAGQASTALSSVTRAVPAGSLDVTGVAPSLGASPVSINVPVGVLTLSGAAATLPSFIVELRQDSTVIATRRIALTASYATYSYDLSGAEVAAITDWTALRLVFIADGEQASVSWAEISAPAGAGQLSLTPSAGTLTLTGLAPTVLTSVSVAVPAGALTLTGAAPSAALSLTVGIPAGSLTITGQAPTLTLTLALNVPAGSLTLTGAAPTTPLALTVTPAVGALTITGQTPATGGAVTITPAVGALTVSGQAPTTPLALTIGIPAGSLALGGLAPTAQLALTASPGAGSVTITGRTPTTGGAVAVDLEVGALTLAGQAPAVRLALTIGVPAGALALTGRAPAALVSVTTAIPAGSLTLAGYAPTALVSVTVAPGVGSLTLTGAAPTPAEVHVAAPGSGSLTLTGAAPTAFVQVSIAVPAGTLTITGRAPSAPQTGQVIPAAGTLTLAGQAPSLQRTYVVTPPTGSLSVTGQAPATAPNIQRLPGVGALTLSGAAPTLVAQLSVSPGVGSLTLTGHLATIIAVGVGITKSPDPGTITLTGQAPLSPFVGGGGFVIGGDSDEQATPFASGVCVFRVPILSYEDSCPEDVGFNECPPMLRGELGGGGGFRLGGTGPSAGGPMPDGGIIELTGQAPSLQGGIIIGVPAGGIGAEGQ